MPASAPGVPLGNQQEADLLWIREEFPRARRISGKYIVHGHTPVRSAEVLANRANIDTGAYATGNLTLLSIQGSRLLAVCDGDGFDQWLGLTGLWSGNRLSVAAFRNLKCVIDVASSFRRRWPLAISVPNRS
jgi:hypothetical protein